MVYAYARVSTKKQSTSSQLSTLKEYGYDRLVEEKISGRAFKRDVLDKLIEDLRYGDVLLVWKIDRLSRSLDGVIRVYLQLKEKGVAIVSVLDKIDTREPLGNFFLMVLGWVAENDFFSIKERQRAGIEVRKKSKLSMGRPKGLSKESNIKAELAYRLYKEGRKVSEIMKETGIVSRATIYKYLRLKGIEI